MHMLFYLIRRILYALPIILGVNLITFALFFMVNTPDDMARAHLGERYATSEAIARWKHNKGFDKPLFFNDQQIGLKSITDTLFFHKSLELFAFDFGTSEQGRDIRSDIAQRMWPSLALAIPTLLLGLLTNISFAMLLVFFRGSYLDRGGVMLCTMMMSISALFYIITGQFFMGSLLHLAPISGYLTGWEGLAFLGLPLCIGVLSGLGAGTRWYRLLLLEELQKDYVRTAKAKGLSEGKILRIHVLKNCSIPIVTGVVALLPLLFMGSLLMESFFGIPGLGSYTIDAIQQQDFDIVRVMVFLGTVFYIIGLILTDITYTWLDPRICFE